MAYNKTTWKTGDVITAEKLNNAENGIAAASPFIINLVVDEVAGTLSLDQTYGAILAAQLAGRYCPVISPEVPDMLPAEPYGFVYKAYGSDGSYNVDVANDKATIGETHLALCLVIFTCSSADDYPVLQIE